MFPDLLRELPGGFEFRASGGLIYFLTPGQGAVFEEFVDGSPRRRARHDSLIDGAEVRRLVPPIRDDVLGASYCSEDAQMVTSTFVDALARGARAAGAEIREGVTVERLVLDGDRVVGVATDDGRIDADAVVVAMGAWSTALLADARCGRADRRRAPPGHGHDAPAVLGRAARLRPERDQAVRALPGPAVMGCLVVHWRTAIAMTPRSCCRCSSSGHPARSCSAARRTTRATSIRTRPWPVWRRSRAASRRTSRRCANVPITQPWAGYLPFTSDQAPVIDEVMPGLFVAAGHAFGNSAGPVTGRVISELIAGREPSFDISECRYGRPLDPIVVGAPTHW